MAFLNETLRSLGLTSIFGRRLMLDPNDYIVGPRAVRTQIEDLTTVATTLAAFGMSRVTATGSSQGPVQYTLPAPVPGVIKRLALATTSTGSYQFLSTANGASILSASDGTTKSVVNLIGQGGVVTLFGVSTSVWQVVTQTGSTGVPNVSYTTST